MIENKDIDKEMNYFFLYIALYIRKLQPLIFLTQFAGKTCKLKKEKVKTNATASR